MSVTQYVSHLQVDFDYGYTSSGNSNLNINIRSPYTVATEVSMANSRQGTAIIRWNPSNNDRQVRFDFGLKNVETPSMTDRAVNFKTTVSRRTVGFAVGYKITADRVTSNGQLHWDRDSQPDFAYDLDTRRTSGAYNGRLKVTSYLINTDSTFSHRVIGERHFVSEVVLDLAERLTMKSDLNLASPNAMTHTLTIQHPRMSRVCTSSLSMLHVHIVHRRLLRKLIVRFNLFTRWRLSAARHSLSADGRTDGHTI